jgi:hypothetical protein
MDRHVVVVAQMNLMCYDTTECEMTGEQREYRYDEYRYLDVNSKCSSRVICKSLLVSLIFSMCYAKGR